MTINVRFLSLIIIFFIVAASLAFFFLTPSAPLPSASVATASVAASEKAKTATHDDEAIELNWPPSSSPSFFSSPSRKTFINVNNMSECARLFPINGTFWSFEVNRCQIIDGWAPPLRSYEVSREELTCSNEKRGRRVWKTRAFRDSHEALLEKLTTNTSSCFGGDGGGGGRHDDNYLKEGSRAACVSDHYRRFHFFTSWLFRQWSFWAPRPNFDRHSNKNKNDDSGGDRADKRDAFFRRPMRAYHDAKRENIYRLENFCLTPTGGLFGFNASIQEFAGRDDTRNSFHHERTYGAFFSRAFSIMSEETRRRLMIPPWFDRRPVIFVRVAPLSRFHIYHLMNKFLSLLGILKFHGDLVGVKSKYDKFSSSADSTSDSDDEDPLVIIVNEALDDERDSQRTTALGFLFRMLDVPWAVVDVPSHIRAAVSVKRDPRKYYDFVSLHYREKMNQLVDHGVVTSGDTTEPVMCFERGIASQNCFFCDKKTSTGQHDEHRQQQKQQHDPLAAPSAGLDEFESYSFGMWSSATPRRVSIVRDFQILLANCLPFSSSSLSLPSSSSSSQSVRIFFAVRTLTRTISDFPLMIEPLQKSVATFHANRRIHFMFREPWRGSRAQYLDDLRSADVFVCMHGGDCVLPVMMRKGSVVVEITFADALCPDQRNAFRLRRLQQQKRQATAESNKKTDNNAALGAGGDLIFTPRCWFGVFSDSARAAKHILFELEQFQFSSSAVRISKQALADLVNYAVSSFVLESKLKNADDDDGREEVAKMKLFREKFREQYRYGLLDGEPPSRVTSPRTEMFKSGK